MQKHLVNYFDRLGLKREKKKKIENIIDAVVIFESNEEMLYFVIGEMIGREHIFDDFLPGLQYTLSKVYVLVS